MFYLVAGSAFCYAILKNQIIIEDEVIVFRRLFFERSYKIDHIDSIDIFPKGNSNGAEYHLKIISGGNAYSHNLSIYKYADAMAVLNLLLQRNPAIKPEMGARDAIRFKPDYW